MCASSWKTAISPDAPATLQDGGAIREGYSEELDDLRQTRDGARDFIAGLQSRERERTGINSLKVGFNRVFGYYLEVTKANLDKVPEDYVRKQTLTNAERYFTPELKEWEEKVFGAEDRMEKLEAELFGEVRRRVAAEVSRCPASRRRGPGPPASTSSPPWPTWRSSGSTSVRRSTRGSRWRSRPAGIRWWRR